MEFVVCGEPERPYHGVPAVSLNVETAGLGLDCGHADHVESWNVWITGAAESLLCDSSMESSVVLRWSVKRAVLSSVALSRSVMIQLQWMNN